MFKYHSTQMVIATCKSAFNLRKVATFVRKVYKLKRVNQCENSKQTTPLPRFDGLKEKAEWLAFDMGKK